MTTADDASVENLEEEVVAFDMGQWRVNADGKMFRKGQFKYPNHDFYDGEWLDGKRGGKGLYQYHNGDKYVGDFKEGYWHGFGVYTVVPRMINGEHIIGRRYEGSILIL